MKSTDFLLFPFYGAHFMNPALTIAELIALPTFGINKVRKIAAENIAQAVVLGYTFIRQDKVLRVNVKSAHPGNETKALSRFVELEVTTEATNVAFITKVKEGHFLAHGELKSDEFKEAFLTLYLAQQAKKLSYGTDPVVSTVIHSNAGVATIYFSSIKNGKRVPHTARWSRLNLDKSLNVVVVVPRSVYNSYREFLAIVAGLLEVPPERLFLKEDPIDAIDGVDVYVDTNDLVYFGKIKVAVTPGGSKAMVYSKDATAIEPEEPEEPEEGEGGGEGTGTPSNPGNEPPDGDGDQVSV